MSERDLVPCPATGKLIDRADLLHGVPRKLWHTCPCGERVEYGIEHHCDFVARDPDEEACGSCGRYRCNCAHPSVEEGVKA